MITTTIDKVAGVLKNIYKMEKARVLVGIPQGDSGRDDAITNSALGYIHEFGSPARNIPARPFLIPGIKAVQDEAAELLKEGAKEVLDDGSMSASLNKAGIIGQNSVKAAITKGEGFAPLQEATIKARQRKGVKGTKPLIRTGQLRNSITYVVKGI